MFVSLTIDQLFNNQHFAELLSGEDMVAMQYLSDLTVEEYEDSKSGYQIAFVSSVPSCTCKCTCE